MAASKIFICYRRDDTAAYAGHLHADLRRHFEEHEVFMDLGIQPGDDFVEQVKVAIASCAVLLVIIGREWLSVTDDRGGRRREDPKDLVRLEIAMALERGVVVIPLLVREAPMPREHQLPTPLAPLARRNALPLRDYGWDDDVGRLVDASASSADYVKEAAGPRRSSARAQD